MTVTMNFIKKKEPRKILILRFGAIGDIVHSSALFRSLKKFNPDFEIHYATFKIPSALLSNDPDIKKVWIFENKSYKCLLNLAKKLRKEKFDLFINLQPSIKTKVFELFLNSGKTLTYKKTFKLHAVENFWITAKKEFKNIILDESLKIYIPDEVINKVSNFINSEKKTIVFNLGASNIRQGRKWPVEYWKQLAKSVIDKYNVDIILNGSEEDAEISEKLLDISSNIRSYCGKLSILESSGLISLCSLIISGDTGPLHIATALEVPAIGLYGAAPISRTGPYGKLNFDLCSDRKCVPCNRRKCNISNKDDIYNPCMTDIKPKEVIDIVDDIFFT